MEKFDKDNSGSLDIEEFKVFIKHMLSDTDCERQGYLDDKELNVMFANFDKDNSGKLEKTEIAALIMKIAGSEGIEKMQRLGMKYIIRENKRAFK